MPTDDLTLVDRIGVLIESLNEAGVPYLVGGDLALAFQVAEPRATQHIDIQVHPRPTSIRS